MPETTEQIGEIVVRIPIMRGVITENGNSSEYAAAGNVKIISAKLPENHLHQELIVEELADGDFWGDTNLYGQVFAALTGRPMSERHLIAGNR